MAAVTPPCWYKNTSTGQIWHVEGPMADRLLADPGYERLAEPHMPPGEKAAILNTPEETSSDGGGTEAPTEAEHGSSQQHGKPDHSHAATDGRSRRGRTKRQ